MRTLIGPFQQIITLENLPLKGAIQDEQLVIRENAGVLVNDGFIEAVDDFEALAKNNAGIEVEKVSEPMVLLPGLVDAHTHICFGGSRARDYAMRNAGKPYLEIARAGGGILDSVRKTREATLDTLVNSTYQRATRHLHEGVTTCEVKSGYGLSIEAELKMLEAIQKVNETHVIDIVPTCLAAHMRGPEYQDSVIYLDDIIENLLPKVKAQGLASRVDIFIEDTAFSVEEGRRYLIQAQSMGFDITIHADQFSTGGSKLATALGAISADHLEASTDKEINALALSDTVSVVLPGVSFGLGMDYAPGRKLLDRGACVAIATDWNPGSAPMGDLLLQAAVYGAVQKLSNAEVFAGITFRAAQALNLQDRGQLVPGQLADFIGFATPDYQEILYQQGKLKPAKVWKRGELYNEK
ncbi:MAG TPA: imidazolonepropionase [Microscillaceae bacterium]|nr:imidazolonepropionase [Microscillaceae bacterium]